ncbi:MAG: DNA polymerase IV [Candidatus Krumholzibacteriota bacterium]|nr:DNA polymerase IV [Candidatus Krumholzibacteriota bacterium]
MQRAILHVNTDDFYASILRLRDPALRGRPVVVAGPAPRGMVFSASYEARGEGVVRGMTVSTAKRLSPSGAFPPPDWDLFRRASAAVFDVLRRYSPLVETDSLDEGYVDYTGCERLFGRVLDAGSRIRREIRDETGLDVSLGVATSKLVSHVASRTAKRESLVDVYPGYERAFLDPVPIDRFPPVPPRRAGELRFLGVARVGDLLLFDEEILAAVFGPWGRRLYRGARGEDDSVVRPCPAPDTRFVVETVLEPDRVSRRRVEAHLALLAGRLGARLRGERLLARRLELEIGYADEVAARGRAAICRSGTERSAPGAGGRGNGPGGASSLDDDLFAAARGALARLCTRRVRVRRLRLCALVVEPEPLQIDLFAGGPGPRERARRLCLALDGLRERFGDRAAAPGRAWPALDGSRAAGPAAARPRSAPAVVRRDRRRGGREP